jgi:hypothetical protein
MAPWSPERLYRSRLSSLLVQLFPRRPFQKIHQHLRCLFLASTLKEHRLIGCPERAKILKSIAKMCASCGVNERKRRYRFSMGLRQFLQKKMKRTRARVRWRDGKRDKKSLSPPLSLLLYGLNYSTFLKASLIMPCLFACVRREKCQTPSTMCGSGAVPKSTVKGLDVWRRSFRK